LNKMRERANAHCSTLPGAELSDPWGGGHDCWKVGGKMFASMGAKDLGVSIKCGGSGEAAMLIEAGRAERALSQPWRLGVGPMGPHGRGRVIPADYEILCDCPPQPPEKASR